MLCLTHILFLVGPSKTLDCMWQIHKKKYGNKYTNTYSVPSLSSLASSSHKSWISSALLLLIEMLFSMMTLAVWDDGCWQLAVQVTQYLLAKCHRIATKYCIGWSGLCHLSKAADQVSLRQLWLAWGHCLERSRYSFWQKIPALCWQMLVKYSGWSNALQAV